MVSLSAKLALTSTALAPVGFTYAVSAWAAGENKAATIIVFVSIFLVILCSTIFAASRRQLAPFQFQIDSLEVADRENTSLIIVYLLPLFTADFEALNWVVWIPAILVIAITVGTGYSYHFNPILGMLGWHFYKATTPDGVSYVVLTKKELRSTRKDMKVGQLTEYIVVDLE